MAVILGTTGSDRIAGTSAADCIYGDPYTGTGLNLEPDAPGNFGDLT